MKRLYHIRRRKSMPHLIFTLAVYFRACRYINGKCAKGVRGKCLVPTVMKTIALFSLGPSQGCYTPLQSVTAAVGFHGREGKIKGRGYMPIPVSVQPQPADFWFLFFGHFLYRKLLILVWKRYEKRRFETPLKACRHGVSGTFRAGVRYPRSLILRKFTREGAAVLWMKFQWDLTSSWGIFFCLKHILILNIGSL